MPDDLPRQSVLFVCLGNICRSPTAEAVFRATAQREGVASRFAIDSAGTIGWHAGNPPDWRAIAHAAKRMPRLIRIVHVRPLSVISGIAAAALGTIFAGEAR